MSNWIDHALEQAEVRKLFTSVLATGPVLRGRAGALPALAADPAAQTYWQRRRPSASEPAVDRLAACDSVDALVEGLAAFWRDRDQPELADLAPTFAALANHLKGLSEPTAELPYLIYTLL